MCCNNNARRQARRNGCGSRRRRGPIASLVVLAYDYYTKRAAEKKALGEEADMTEKELEVEIEGRRNLEEDAAEKEPAPPSYGEAVKQGM